MRRLPHPRDHALFLSATRWPFRPWRLRVNGEPVESDDPSTATMTLADGSPSEVRVTSRAFDPFPIFVIDGERHPIGGPLGISGVIGIVLPLLGLLQGLGGILVGLIGAFVMVRLARAGVWPPLRIFLGFLWLMMAASIGVITFLLIDLAIPTLPQVAARDAIARLAATAPHAPIPVGTGAIAPTSVEDVLELRRLVRAGKYAEAEGVLKALEDSARGDVRREARWLAAYRGAFEVGDTLLEPVMDRWVRASPRSAEALTARAWYRYALAFFYRGTGSALTVRAQGRQGFAWYLANGGSDASNAIIRDRDLLPAYWMLLNTARAEGDQVSAITLLDRALARSPGSAVSYKQAMIAFYPRWGGSFEEMATLAESAELSADLNPELARFDAFVPYEQGRVLGHRSDGGGLPYLAAALRGRREAIYYYAFGHALGHAGRYEMAIAALDSALALDPTAAEVWADRAQWHGQWARADSSVTSAQMREARRDNAVAASLDPGEAIDLSAPFLN